MALFVTFSSDDANEPVELEVEPSENVHDAACRGKGIPRVSIDTLSLGGDPIASSDTFEVPTAPTPTPTTTSGCVPHPKPRCVRTTVSRMA